MVAQAQGEHDLSARRIAGFACNQAFLYTLFYRASSNVGNLSVLAPLRADSLATLLFMVLGFGLVLTAGKKRSAQLFSRPLLYIYAVVATIGSLIPAFAPESSLLSATASGFFTGIPCAILLTAWGRSFGGAPRASSIPEVFLGSLVAALLMLVFSLSENSDVVIYATRLLPLASVVNIEFAERKSSQADYGHAASGDADDARKLSTKMLAGTFLFGVAAGVIELHFGATSAIAGIDASQYRVSMIVFAAYLIGGLTLLLSDGFERGAALGTSYRLAVFVMLVGILLMPIPLLSGSTLSGQSIMLAGYLGLEVVLVSLFVVIADITATDCALSFSSGFLALFLGEAVGALFSSMFANLPGVALEAMPIATAISGALMLVSFVFLFTDRDFDELSHIVSNSDSFQETCDSIVERYGLSKREAEILAYALRGRTSERIAQELVIAKSTVDTHLRRIYVKCGVRSRQELLDLAESNDPK